MRVLFVNMPFGSVRPAIGISLLKAHLARLGVASDIAYLNLRLVERLGWDDFHAISDLSPPQSLMGDWVFAACVFDRLPKRDYIDMLASRFETSLGSDLDDMARRLNRAREMARVFLDECLTAVDWSAYDVVGFTTTFTQTLASVALAQRVKGRFPSTTIVFGGANCEGEMGLQLHRSFPVIDVVCSGEADLSFPALVEALRSGDDAHAIPGVIARRNGSSFYASLQPERIQDLDTLPYPDYDDYFEQCRRILPNPTQSAVLMESSRGCWWGEKSHCTFCGLNGLSMAYRAKSQQRALDELLSLTSRYATPRVEMVDNILDMHYFRELLPELKRREIGLDLFYETKANLKKDQVQLLREAGVATIQPGIESFSTPVLRLMRKGTTALQNVQLLKWCKQFGVTCHWNLIYGFPGEDPADYASMVALIGSLHHLDPPSGVGPVRLDRFSPYFVEAEQLGLCNVRPDRSYQYVYDLPEGDLANLAYYFEHEYADGREHRSYAQGLHEAFARWTANADKSGLVYVDDGVTLRIQDYRVGTTTPATNLTGIDRALYVACDQQRSFGQLVELAGSATVVEAFVHAMLERRLLASADDRFLSLALPAAVGERPAPVELDPAELEQLRAKLAAWRQELSDREQELVQRLLGSELLGC